MRLLINNKYQEVGMLSFFKCTLISSIFPFLIIGLAFYIIIGLAFLLKTING